MLSVQLTVADNYPYMFTGRRVDFLDGGKLTLQINRHRYYDYYTGRWLTEDTLGMIPNGSKHNLFHPRMQYFETLSLYQFVSGNPVGAMDPYGFYGCLEPGFSDEDFESLVDALEDAYWYYPDEGMSDKVFFIKFLLHRYFGMGAPWTIGAANVKRNDYVIREPKVKLRKIAGTICGEMKDKRVCSKHGPVAEVFHWPGVRADDNFYMKATLNGPWAFFVNGHYFATRFPDDGSDLCACKVVFNNSYLWHDWGDLELKFARAYAADDIQWVIELLYKVSSLGVGYFTCRDFPVEIEWPDSSTLIFSGGGQLQEASGWPFDEGY